MRRFAILISRIAMLATLAIGAGAQAASPTPLRIDPLLAAIDVVPTSRAELERQVPDAQRELTLVAEDGARGTWTRLRAIAFLSFYPDAATRGTLAGLMRATAPEIRRAAVYTLGRAFGPLALAEVGRGVADLVADVAERDADASVREHATRALRWIDEPAAAARLERIVKVRPELADLAKVTAERRGKRLAR